MTVRKLHQFPWNEVVVTTKPMVDSGGTLWTGPDRKADRANDPGNKRLFVAWLKDVQTRARLHNDLDPAVMASFQSLKALSAPPTAIIQESNVIPFPAPQHSFKPPKFSWSFSSLNLFETCPLQYAHKHFYKTIKFEGNAATQRGDMIHQALERACKGQATPNDNALIQTHGWGKYVNAILAAPGEKYFELEMGLNDVWKPENRFKAQGRCKGDVLIINGDKANYIDWKTGESTTNKWDKGDPDVVYQLELSLLFVALHYPQVKLFNGKFICLDVDRVVGLERPLERKELMRVYVDTKSRIERVKQAWESEVFQANKSGLCRKWCEVRQCAHCGK